MKKITQTLEYNDDARYELTNNLSDWHKHTPLIDNGVDWEFQLVWATMTDEDCVLFCLKHPQWAHRFRTV